MTPWSFVHATDIHVGSPRSFRFAPAFNENCATARRQIVALREHLGYQRLGWLRLGEVVQFQAAVKERAQKGGS